jgi:hypothetical protein
MSLAVRLDASECAAVNCSKESERNTQKHREKKAPQGSRLDRGKKLPLSRDGKKYEKRLNPPDRSSLSLCTWYRMKEKSDQMKGYKRCEKGFPRRRSGITRSSFAYEVEAAFAHSR